MKRCFLLHLIAFVSANADAQIENKSLAQDSILAHWNKQNSKLVAIDSLQRPGGDFVALAGKSCSGDRVKSFAFQAAKKYS